VFLAIVDSALPPREISALLGIDADRVLNFGHPTPTNRNKLAEVNRWEVRVPVDEGLELSHHLLGLKALVQPRVHAIRQLAKEASIRIEVDIDYPTNEAPRSVEGIHFDRDVVDLVASIGGEFDVDISI
jgi:hypothetical protein